MPSTTLPLDAADGGSLGTLGDWAVSLMDALGGPGAAILVGLDNLFPPIPSELILPLAGFAAARGTFTLAEALIWTTAGSVIGAMIVYLLGALLGRARVVRVFQVVPLLRVSDFEASERWFLRHGGKAVFFGRLVPIFRSLISLPAGVTRMRFWWFLLLTTVGSAIWNTIFVLAGYFLGANWHVVEGWTDTFQYAVIGAVLLAIAVFVALRVRTILREKRERRDGPTGPDAAA